MPARTSMMTGRYPSHFGMRSNGQAPIPPEAISNALGNVFRKAGYQTVFGGKTHWPKPMTPESLGFEYISADERNELAGACSDFLRQKHEKPFLMVASFINPHDICYMAIDAYTKANQLAGMHPKAIVERECVAEASVLPDGVSREEFYAKHCPPIPANHGPTSEEPEALGRFGSFRGYVRKHWREEEWRLHRWVYARLTERVDAEIGRLLATLRETGLDRNTMVLFASDHGDMDAAHGFEHKSLSYEESARVPFIVSWPGHTPAGKVDRKHLVSSCVDLMPTLCDYAGIEPPPGLPGRSVRRIVERGSQSGWRQDVAIECSGSRSVRTSRFKYTLFEGPGKRELLTDMNKDPGEMTNLVSNPRFAAVLADHRKRLRQAVEELNDDYGRTLLKELTS
jgi:choline-sulfatase